MIIVHRRELVEQAAHHCRLAYPDRTVEVEMGNSSATGYGDIVVASIRSLMSQDRLYKFDPSQFKLILVDEAHHIVAKSYREVLGHFELNETSPDSPALVGVSATFSRSDGLKLGAAIDFIVYHKDYMDMIDENWLANAVFTTVRSGANLSKVKRDKFGDFALSSLSEAVDNDKTNNITVRAWMANAHDRKSTLAFCVDVQHTKSLTDTFRQYGIDARYITASTPKDVRAEQLRAFRNQEYPVLLNCGLFTEGTDIPNIDCVLLARPTRSRNLLIQMIGRGLRLFPGKKNCHIIDMVATLETGVLSTPTLFGLHPDEVLEKSNVKELRQDPDVDISLEGGGEAQQQAQQQHKGDETEANQPPEDEEFSLEFTHYESVMDLISDIRQDKHIRSFSQNAWVRTGDNRYVLSSTNGWITIEKDDDTTTPPLSSPPLDPSNPSSNSHHTDPLYTVHHVIKFNETDSSKKPTYTRPRLIAQAPSLESAVRAADTYASTVFEDRYINAWQGWRQAGATPSQLKILNQSRLRKRPIHWRDVTRGQAGDMITRLKFGGRGKFKEMVAQKTKKAEKKKKREEGVGEVKRMGMGDVRVGPVQD